MLKSNLKELMDKEGITIWSLSDKLKVARPGIKQLYNNDIPKLISSHTLDEICKHYSINIGQLLEYVPKESA